MADATAIDSDKTIQAARVSEAQNLLAPAAWLLCSCFSCLLFAAVQRWTTVKAIGACCMAPSQLLFVILFAPQTGRQAVHTLLAKTQEVLQLTHLQLLDQQIGTKSDCDATVATAEEECIQSFADLKRAVSALGEPAARRTLAVRPTQASLDSSRSDMDTPSARTAAEEALVAERDSLAAVRASARSLHFCCLHGQAVPQH
eukprot:SAG31_NODE_895_length_11169_cov_3.114182_8_plen_201_part_00